MDASVIRNVFALRYDRIQGLSRQRFDERGVLFVEASGSLLVETSCFRFPPIRQVAAIIELASLY